MGRGKTLRVPFFEIGPKSYLFGGDVLELALAADKASAKYNVDILFTAPVVDVRRIAEAAGRLFVLAPHMDPLLPGRGVADILGESLAAAGVAGVMLNHAERPLTLNVLERTITRARECGLLAVVCTDTVTQASAAAHFHPDVIVTEPSDLIGTGRASGLSWVLSAIAAVKAVDPGILVLQGAGISSGKDVYDVIFAGAEATGSSSAIVKAIDRPAMVNEMIRAVREAWDARNQQ
jgi:triosephosphate isomerase